MIQLAKYFGKDALQPLSYYEEVWSETGSPMCCLGPKKVVDFSGIFSTNGRFVCTKILFFFCNFFFIAEYFGLQRKLQIIITDIWKVLFKRVLERPLKFSINTDHRRLEFEM